MARTVWTLTGLLVLTLHLYPIRFTGVRVLLLLGLFVLWGGALFLFWNRNRVRYGCFILGTMVSLLLLPGRAADPERMRQAYTQSLLAYQGTRYVWGGENHLGIDCSGLMRCGLVDANVQQGTLTANPDLLRNALALWWHDSSARALKDGHRNQTQFVLRAGSLNTLDHTKILPGDLAVTENGLHVLAYLGGRVWIEADPTLGKVVAIRAPSPNGWFGKPVHIVRWRQMKAERVV